MFNTRFKSAFAKSNMSMSPLESELTRRAMIPQKEASMLANPVPKLHTPTFLREPKIGTFAQPRIRY